MNARRAIPYMALPLVLVACARCATGTPQPESIVLMSYNLQTLFDPVDQGGEYDDFSVAGGTWDEARYRDRLAALSSAILAASAPVGTGASRVDAGRGDAMPDVIVVQEAENERVLGDLAAAVGGYPYVVASPDEDSTLSCGLMSRWPPVSARAHRVRSPDGAPSSTARYILEVELDVGGRRLVVLAVHLKSKLGGAPETEPERRAAAAFIGGLARSRTEADPALALLVMGDFNENPDEFERVGGAYPTAMMPPGSGSGDWLLVDGDRSAFSGGNISVGGSAAEEGAGIETEFTMFCPWDEAGGYSYRYLGVAERIDQILMSPALVSGGGCPFGFESFSASPPEFTVDARGTPIRWDQASSAGYSDHLPIRARLSMSP